MLDWTRERDSAGDGWGESLKMSEDYYTNNEVSAFTIVSNVSYWRPYAITNAGLSGKSLIATDSNGKLIETKWSPERLDRTRFELGAILLTLCVVMLLAAYFIKRGNDRIIRDLRKLDKSGL